MTDSTAQNLISLAEKLRAEKDQTDRRYEDAQERLRQYQGKCSHSFTEVYDPVNKPRYHIAGDPPGTMGVDRQLPMDVPPETIPRWRRNCSKCGLEEYTQKTSEQVTKVPKWGGSGR